jgi:transposase
MKLSTKKMIKSTKTTLKYTNKNKQLLLQQFINEYKFVMEKFVDILWELDKVPSLLPKSITDNINSWLSARAIQCAGKQASGIVRGSRIKQNKRLFVYNLLVKEGKFKKARKLKVIIDKAKVSKPDLNNINPELDERFVRQDWDNSTSFDGIITLTSLGNKLNIAVPIKKNKHFNKMLNQGTIKKGIRLSTKSITFNFDIPDVPKKEQGITLGLDIGVKNTFTLSNGICSQSNNHGYNLDKINKILSRKKKGSKAFEKTQSHRKNYINWSLNQINLDNIKKIKIENIKYLRFGKRSSRYLSHFTYTEIFNKLNSLSVSSGVQLEKVNPTYTSKRCSCCGWVRSKNRNGKQFKCDKCGFAADADLNASLNILADLRPIGRQERLLHKSKKGFYWNEVGKELIVPFAQKVNAE